MDPKELSELEDRCVQERPPFCTAFCPLHMDVRQFVRHMSTKSWTKARETLDRTLPFPGILGRICDHPCEAKCRRGEKGDSIAIGALERACVNETPSTLHIHIPPEKDMPVLIIGTGISGLTAAWDLRRKGYPVTLLDRANRLGDVFYSFPDMVLPHEIIEKEINRLTQLGVVTRLNATMDTKRFSKEIHAYHAVFIDLRVSDASLFGLETCDGVIKVDPLTLQTSNAQVFAGGFPEPGKPRSWVLEAAQGRWGATSIDRYVKHVSLTASRETQGPFNSRLFTEMDSIQPSSRIPISDPGNGYAKTEAEAEASRCIHCECMECVKKCLYLEKFKGYPKTYAREIYNSEKIVWGRHPANFLINSCSLCGLCEEICPEHFSMADLCLSQRMNMVKKGFMPPSAHEFALDDMQFANGEKASLIMGDPDNNPCAYLFFPGCQLSASSPEHVFLVYEHLRKKIHGGVGLALRCCGIPAHWAGRDDLFNETMNLFIKEWEALNKPVVIFACASCHALFKNHLKPEKMASLWEVLERTGLPDSLSQGRVKSRLAVHDSCAARHEENIQKSVRSLLIQMGHKIEELPLGRNLTQCCGFGGLMSNANPPLAREVIEDRARQSETDYVAYCAMCRDRLSTTGKRAFHLLDLIWDISPGTDPAARKAPGYSLRRENRIVLKKRILKTFRKKNEYRTEAHESINVAIPPDILEKIEQRHILVDDIKKVLHGPDNCGTRFFNPATNHFLIGSTPGHITFWVEYSKEGDQYMIHNAYSHRMTSLGPSKV